MTKGNKCTGVTPWKVLALASTTILMGNIDNSAVSVALPQIARHFHLTVTDVSWVAVAYMLTLSCSLLMAGRLSDKLGHKNIFLIGIVIFMLSSLACSLSPGSMILIGMRAIQGIGSALMSTAIVAIAVGLYESGKRGVAFGVVGTAAALGMGIGPVVGGVITEYYGWRFIFVINIPLGIAIFLFGIYLIVTDSNRKTASERLNGLNAFTMAVGIFLLLLALSKGNIWGYGIRGSGGLLIGSLLVFGVYIILERKSDHPLVPFDLLKKPIFTLSAGTIVLFSIATISYSLLLPFYLHDLRGFSVDKTGLVMSIVPVWLIVFSILSGKLSDKVPAWIPATLAIFVGTSGTLGLSTLTAQSPVWHILGWLSLIGIGLAFFTTPNINLLYSQVPESELGIASGIRSFVRNVGVVFGYALAGALYSLKGTTGEQMDPASAIEGFALAYRSVAAIAVAAIILSVLRVKFISKK